MTPIIIDGCLNCKRAYPNGYCGLCWRNVRQLNKILDRTPAQIVISSAWRYLITQQSMTTRGFENLLLSHGVNCYGRVLDHTFEDEIIGERGLQIREWLNIHGGDRAYVIIDDGGENADGSWSDLFIDQYHSGHIVWIREGKGLRSEHVQRAIRILRERGETNQCPSASSLPSSSNGTENTSTAKPSAPIARGNTRAGST